MHIIGTAGHVDHGKSSLVLSLTGTNPDRWAEERLRGMTLDLGFAHLTLDGGIEAGIVDVPGHERFLHNMLAGAAGMELLLLVVAADEGVMPQTIEHINILRYLDVRSIIVVITKIDALDSADIGPALLSIRASLRDTIAQDALVFCVSNLTGDGLEALRDGIREELARLPQRNHDAPPYLPIDRVFALPGHGTVVTGTLMQGTIATGEHLRIQPQKLDVRAKALQTFNQRIDRATPGMRVAVNLPGIDRIDAKRGNALCGQELRAVDALHVKFAPLGDAVTLLRRRNAVRAYIGSAEILGTLVLDNVPQAGETADAQLYLREPVVALNGAPFIVRRLSPKNLLGGGRIVSSEVAEFAPPVDEVNAHDEAVMQVLRASELTPLSSTDIASKANLREPIVETSIARLIERGAVLRVSRPMAYVAMDIARTFLDHTLAALAEAEDREPWALGTTSVVLARTLEIDETLLVRLLGAFVEDGAIANRGGYYSTSEYSPRLTTEQQRFFDEIVPPTESFVPVPFADVLPHIKQSRVPGITRAFDMMLGRGIFVKVGDELYRGSQIRAIHVRVEGFLRQNRQMTMAEFRNLLGTSRKYAVPLLEWFDARGITIRTGDYRVLRTKKEPATTVSS